MYFLSMLPDHKKAYVCKPQNVDCLVKIKTYVHSLTLEWGNELKCTFEEDIPGKCACIHSANVKFNMSYFGVFDGHIQSSIPRPKQSLCQDVPCN